MKFTIIIMLISFAVSGCISTKSIGKKYEFIEPNIQLNHQVGYLKVHTVKFEKPGEFSDDNPSLIYKGYSVYSKTGGHIKDIPDAERTPILVKLDKGEYIIVAELQKNIRHSFVVEIQKGKIIEIDASMLANPFASF